MHQKAHLISRIVEMNPTAEPEWLDRFDEPALSRYLSHLHHAQEPRGRGSFWLRSDETPAVVTRRPAA